MPTSSSRYGLTLPAGGDLYHRSWDVTNWGILDAYAAEYVCTSTTRPTWGSGQAGLRIWESDTGIVWRWTGTTWIRTVAQGLLQVAHRTTNFSVSGTTPVSVITAVATIPNGGRTIEIKAACPSVVNASGPTLLSFTRDGTTITSWTSTAMSDYFVYPDVPSSGSHTYSLLVATTATSGGTSYLNASSSAPITLEVVEV